MDTEQLLTVTDAVSFLGEHMGQGPHVTSFCHLRYSDDATEIA